MSSASAAGAQLDVLRKGLLDRVALDAAEARGP